MDKFFSKIDQLESEGWTKQFVANEPRLSEAVDLYKESGYEVYLEPLPKQNQDESGVVDGEIGECRICFAGSEDQHKIIFTRPLKDASERQDDLF